MYDEALDCWDDYPVEHGCICGNDCEPPRGQSPKRARESDSASEGETWTEYRSAVVYLTEDGTVDDIRETGPTRRSIDEARADAADEEPSMHREDYEPTVARAIVSRTRTEPGEWVIGPLVSGDAS